MKGDVEVLTELIEAIRALCAERMAETADGHMVDVEGIWPSEILTILGGTVPSHE